MRLTLAIGALTAILAAPAPAQDSDKTAAERLEKAIYTQQAKGDLDEAIKMYRDVVNSTPERQFAAVAQYRLVMALIQKGDLVEAQREMQHLAFNYSEFKDVISAMVANGRGIPRGPSISLGTLTIENAAGPNQNQQYTHKITGVSLKMPEGFRVGGDTGSSDGGEMVVLEETGTQAFVAVWLKPNEPGNPIAQLKADLEKKPSQRTDYQGWKIRPESVTYRTVSGQQALSAIADYTENGVKNAEYMTWVRSPKSHVFFFGRTTLDQLPAFQRHFEQVLAGAIIP